MRVFLAVFFIRGIDKSFNCAATSENVHLDMRLATIQISLHVGSLIRIFTAKILDSQECKVY